MNHKVGDGFLHKKTGKYLVIDEIIEFDDGDHRYIIIEPDQDFYTGLDSDNHYDLKQISKYLIKSEAVGVLYGKE